MRSPVPNSKKPLRTALHLFLIVLLGLAVYSNTLNVPFQWDEIGSIMENPVVKDFGYFLSPSDARGLGIRYIDLRDRYVGYLTFAINYRLHGFNVLGYHVGNIALHILNAMLVYALARLTLRAIENITPPSPPIAITPPLPPLSLRGGAGGGGVIPIFVALLFVSHPVQTEAVNYIMGRLPLLMSFFYLSSMALYVKWRLRSLTLIPSPNGRGEGVRETDIASSETPRNDVIASEGSRTPFPGRYHALYALSLLCAVLAMKTKENAFTLPFAIALYEFMFFRRPDNNPPLSPLTLRGGYRSRLYLFPFMLTLLIIPLTRMGTAFVEGGSIYSLTSHFSPVPPLHYLFTQFRVVVDYIRLLFLPVNQSILHDYPVFASFFNPNVFLSFLFLCAVLGLGAFIYRLSKKMIALRPVSFGIFWFFLTLSVESSIFPIPVLMCEYRLYLPSFGIIAAVACGAAVLTDGKRNLRIGAAAVAVVIVIALSYAAHARNEVWRSKASLWEDAVGNAPGSAIAHFNLGYAHLEGKRLDRALQSYQTAIRLKPNFAIAHYNLGIVFLDMGMREKARAEFETALSLNPDNRLFRKFLDYARTP